MRSVISQRLRLIRAEVCHRRSLTKNNVTTTLAYDARLNLHTSTVATAAGNLVTTFTHDPANQLTAVQLPDNSKLTYGFDHAHRLTTVTDLLSNSITYTLDALGDKTLIQVKNRQVPSQLPIQVHLTLSAAR